MKNKTTFKCLILFLLIVPFSYTACRTAPVAAEDHAVLFELVDRDGSLNDSLLTVFCQPYQPEGTQIYDWENRRLIYAVPEDTAFYTRLSELFPSVEIKTYEDPYYVFDRSRCGDEPMAKPWARKIWTANLVANPALQQEYMDYHKNQFEQFPEVAAGFCRAEFQQLVMYRNGRQLILIISYPAGKDYDTLNARTVENNPRVDEWNAIMGRYQEGIEGARPGETFVPFEPLY